MAELFLEERLSECVRVGSGYSEEYDVEIVRTASGQENRILRQPYPRRRFQIAYIGNREEFGQTIVDFYRRVHGKLAGFRLKAHDDFTTAADGVSAHASTDNVAKLVSGVEYQLQKIYPGTPAAGAPQVVRAIYKPVSPTVLVSIYNPGSLSYVDTDALTVFYSTGRIVFDTGSDAITSLATGATTVVTAAGHPFAVGQSVYFSGVSGMTQINDKRGHISAVTASTYTVDINSSGWTAGTGGTATLEPQAGESVYAGCEFDTPVRFDTALPVEYLSDTARSTADIELVELINP